LRQSHFSDINVIKQNSDTEAGLVIAQSPDPDQEVVPEETPVTLTVSLGKGSFPMPNLVGEYSSVAQNILLRNNLVLGEVTYDTSYMEAGKVFRQFPKKAGDMVSPGEKINLYVSTGYPPEAKQLSQDVQVDPSGQSVSVKIVVNDARGEQTQVDQTIDESTTFTVPLVLSPEKNGDIKIYLNDNLYKEVVVPYAE
jgi:serine/threonine-protein kinase